MKIHNAIALTDNSEIKGYVVIENDDINFRVLQRNVAVIGNVVLRAMRDGIPAEEMYDEVKRRINVARVIDADCCTIVPDENAVDAKIDLWNGEVEITYRAQLEWYLNTAINKLPEEKIRERAREAAMKRKLKE
jgi:hypothetical protein